MPRPTKNRLSHPELFTSDLLKELDDSGLSVQAFARRHGLSAWSVYQLRRSLTREPISRSTPKPFVRIHPVAADASTAGDACVLTHPSGWSLSFPPNLSASQLGNLASALKELS